MTDIQIGRSNSFFIARLHTGTWQKVRITFYVLWMDLEREDSVFYSWFLRILDIVADRRGEGGQEPSGKLGRLRENYKEVLLLRFSFGVLLPKS